MPRKKSESKGRAPKGQGSVKQHTYVKNGQTYTCWRARFYVVDPDTGLKQLRELTAPTETEAVEKMNEAKIQIATGTYQFNKSKITLQEWLDEWTQEYLNSVKPYTINCYKRNIENHIKPSKISKVKLVDLTPRQIQKLYNNMTNTATGGTLSPKTLKNIHGTLHRALQKAVDIGLIRSNPSDRADLPKVIPPEIKPLDEADIANFLSVCHESTFSDLYIVTLFCGLRQGEVLGLSWDEINFTSGTITIKQQLQYSKNKGRKYYILPTKNSKPRTIRPAPSIMKLLKNVKVKQFQEMLSAGDAWNNEFNLVFTDESGNHLAAVSVYKDFKQLVTKINRPDARFHDLRHSYAVQSLRNGDDIKTVQNNLGHHTAAFTLQTYAHVTESMLKDSSDRMEAFISSQKFKIG